MKHNKLFSFAVIFVLLMSSNVQAGGWTSSTPLQINKVAFNQGGLFLYANGWSNPNICENTNAVVLMDTDPNYDKAYALVLAAYMSGKKIRGYSDKCVTHDGVTYNMIRGTKYLYVE